MNTGIPSYCKRQEMPAPKKAGTQQNAGPSSPAPADSELRLTNLDQLELLSGMVQRGVSLRTTARGSSMSPFICDRDVLTISPLNDCTPRVGDVAAVVPPGARRLVIHRIIARVSAGWLVRGDNCSQADGVVQREQILGRVTRVERRGMRVRLGLGAEARIIAWLQRAQVLMRAVRVLAWVRRHG
jgi:hypothetical protein